MRLILAVFALVACTTAVPTLEKKAVDVDVLEKQKNVLDLVERLNQDTINEKLLKLGLEYNPIENIERYENQNVVKYLYRLFEMGRIQRKGVPFVTSYPELRKEVALLTRFFLYAKDYETFLKSAAWARMRFNEEQFYKAFYTAILQRHDTKDVVLPAPYETFPYYYFDTRVLKKACDYRIKSFGKTDVGDVIVIPSNYTAWLPMGEDRLAYFTQDIYLASWYYGFSLGSSMMPKTGNTDESTVDQNYDCTHHEFGRGGQFWYVHKQLLALYDLNRDSMGMMPITYADIAHTLTPFKSHLTSMNGIDISGRDYEYNMMPDKDKLVKTVITIQRRLLDAIDKGSVITTKSTYLPLYDKKGLCTLANLMEGTGRSINPRYYGNLYGAMRQLLGGAPIAKNFWEPHASALEIPHTMTRDPAFYKLWKGMNSLFKRWQDSLPSYKQQDLIFPGVEIESLKFDDLITYCEDSLVDIDAATTVPIGAEVQKDFKIKTVVERLNHESYNYTVILRSDKYVNDAVMRFFIGSKYDYWGNVVDPRQHRYQFVEIDQFICDLKQGKNVIKRNSIDAPMRKFDTLTKNEIYRKVQEALNSHEPFYPRQVSDIFGFPENLALPKGRYDGFPVQIFAIITPSEKSTVSYGPVVPPEWQTYYDVDFTRIEGTFKKETFGEYRYGEKSYRHSDEDFSSEDTSGEFRTTKKSSRVRSHEFSGETRRDMRYNRHHDRVRRSGDTEVDFNAALLEKNKKFLETYFKERHITELLGGGISFDGKPLGYPFDRRMSLGCLDIPNVKMVGVKIYHEGKDKCGVFNNY